MQSSEHEDSKCKDTIFVVHDRDAVLTVVLCSFFQVVFEFLAYKMGVAKGTLTKRMKAVLKKREV